MTLIELLVWLSLSMFVLMWVNQVYKSISETWSSINFLANSYYAMDEYESVIEEAKKVYPNIRRIYSWSSFEKRYGFDLVIMADDSNSSWIIFGWYNAHENKPEFWELYYNEIYPFYAFIDSNLVTSAIINSEVHTFLSDFQDSNSYIIKIDDVYLTKFGATNINANDVLKIDFVYSPDFFPSLKMINASDIAKNSDLKQYSFSVIK